MNSQPPINVLHVAAEVYPLIKTGGLADVAGALPPALCAAGADARLLLPGYAQVLAGVLGLRPVATLGRTFGANRAQLLVGRMPDSGVTAYVIDAPWHWRRDGGPYQDAQGRDWSDNLQRFALLGWVAAQLGFGDVDPAWTADVVHAHDWHAALACAYAHAHPAQRAATVFTVHNLAFQGRFDLDDFGLLALPARYRLTDGLEYHRTLSFMKGALQLADHITTVSPTYAREIATPDFGCGLDGVIRSRSAVVSGILNGIDTAVWNPRADAALAQGYDAASPSAKAACKSALQDALGLPGDADAMLVCMVSRLSDQKGLDLVLGALPALLESGAQLVVQGKGDAAIEQALQDAARAHPGRIAVRLVYDEAMAHTIIGGADAILVPSRFEPCGLTQLYGLRYGTLPIVRRVGGLADTVTDAAMEDTATGFTFDAATPEALADALRRAAARYGQPDAWRPMMARAMAIDHSWQAAAQGYLEVYAQALAAQRPPLQAAPRN